MLSDLGIQTKKKISKLFRGIKLKRTGLGDAEKAIEAADDVLMEEAEASRDEDVELIPQQWRSATLFFAIAKDLDLSAIHDGSIALIGSAASSTVDVSIASSSNNTHFSAKGKSALIVILLSLF